MRLLRTAAGGFINAGKIVHLADERSGPANGWIALLGDGEEITLAPYYNVPGRIERDLPHLVAADCAAETCCCGA
jgi:hypothetical protein